MSEVLSMNETPEPTAQEQASASEAPHSAGALLRQAREAAGMQIASLAVLIRVPLKKLEALEADRYDQLPDAVFARALALSICRTLKIDADPILQRLPRTDASHVRTDEPRINVPFQRPGDVAGRSLRSQLPKPALMAVLALLVGALALLFFPEVPEPRAAVDATDAVSATSATVPTAGPLALEAPAPAAVAQPDVAPAIPAQPALPAPASAPTLPAGGDSPVAHQLLQFKTRGPSWVEVTDAKGAVLLRRNLEPGENAAVSGALPLSVVIGRADATEVWVRGQPFPLQNVSSENVARFEVKP